ncbi:MAG: hypothetical protein ACRBB0_05225 [Pelagimonas sp.]|uniref:hypothetical protein n=1 Tax=Pelagimonas sp. TaxID=2073170 RepID=UPI003D6B7D29
MIENFIYWLTDPDVIELDTSAYEFVVIESGVTSIYGAQLSLAELTQLQTAGTPGTDDDRTVLGYVNVAVTDHNRTYWNPFWVSGADPSNPDVGTPTANAPAWLVNALGTARGPVGHGEIEDPNNPGQTIYGPIVDFTDPDWQQIVIDQAVAIVQAGYDGVFLDDVGRYYLSDGDVGQSIPLAERTEAMMELVNAVSDAISAINPDALVYINSDAYMTWNNGDDVTAAEADFMQNVDGILMENLFNTAPYALTAAADVWTGHANILSVEWEDTLRDPGAYAHFSTSLGITTHVPNEASYDDFTPLPTSVPEPEYTVIVGTWQGEVIHGTEGDDLIFALGGDDTVYGGGGNDTIIGGDGNDMLVGGDGNNVLIAGAPPDEFVWGG